MHSEQASWQYYCLGIQMQIKKSTYIMDRRGIVIVGRKVEIITGGKEGATSGLVKREEQESISLDTTCLALCTYVQGFY